VLFNGCVFKYIRIIVIYTCIVSFTPAYSQYWYRWRWKEEISTRWSQRQEEESQSGKTNHRLSHVKLVINVLLEELDSNHIVFKRYVQFFTVQCFVAGYVLSCAHILVSLLK